MSFSYSLGQFVAANKALCGVIAAAVIFGAVSALPDSKQAGEKATQQLLTKERQDGQESVRAQAKAAADAAATLKKEKCDAELSSSMARARTLLKNGQIDKADIELDACKAITTDPAALKLYAEISKTREKQAAVRQAAALKAELAQRKREGVTIGMNRERVLQSNWGKPRKINRTTGASYEDEQWVYDGGYLYFHNGILRTVQH